MTLKERIIRRMVALAGDEASPWTAVPSQVGATVRRTWTHETPDYQRSSWSEPTYDAYAFVTLVAGKFILGTSAAPWVGRQDREIPLWLVEAILTEPELAMDNQRQLDMRHTRRGGRSGDGVRR